MKETNKIKSAAKPLALDLIRGHIPSILNPQSSILNQSSILIIKNTKDIFYAPFKIKQLTLFLSIICICLSGCGFHLRGQIDLPPMMHKFYLDGTSTYTPLIQLLKKRMISSGITVVDDQKKAPLTLFLNSENVSWSQTTISTNNALKNYTVTYSVDFELRDSKGNSLAGPYSVSESDTITALQDEILDNSNKLKIAERDLRDKLTTKILYHLAAKDTINAIKKHENIQ